ncbi:partial demethylmenaquinone methyltransferase / 2-methoxy-6-polyprenyl-1,4-benzoquinol methylase, partial [Anaerolineae bacterium]
RCPSSALVGLNVDPRQLEVAARLTPPPAQGSLSLVAADATNIPFRDGTFDRVLAIECAFHFPSRARFVAEAARVASPGGLLVMSDIVPADSLRAKRDDSYWQGLRLTLEAGLGPWPDFFGDEPPLEALLPEHGLAIEVLRDATARTLPSFASFTRAPSAELQPLLRALSVDDAEASRIDPAVGLLGRLLREGFLRVVYVAARRTARARSV